MSSAIGGPHAWPGDQCSLIEAAPCTQCAVHGQGEGFRASSLDVWKVCQAVIPQEFKGYPPALSWELPMPRFYWWHVLPSHLVLRRVLQRLDRHAHASRVLPGQGCYKAVGQLDRVQPGGCRCKTLIDTLGFKAQSAKSPAKVGIWTLSSPSLAHSGVLRFGCIVQSEKPIRKSPRNSTLERPCRWLNQPLRSTGLLFPTWHDLPTGSDLYQCQALHGRRQSSIVWGVDRRGYYHATRGRHCSCFRMLPINLASSLGGMSQCSPQT